MRGGAQRGKQMLEFGMAIVCIGLGLATLLVRRWQRRREARDIRRYGIDPGLLKIDMRPQSGALELSNYISPPSVPRWPCVDCGALHGRGLHQRCEACK